MWKAIGEWAKAPVSVILLMLGFVATIWACLRSDTTVYGVDIGLDSPGRYVVLALGAAAAVFGIFTGVMVMRSQTAAAQRQNSEAQLPVEEVTVDPPSRIDPPPHAKFRLSGYVKPAKPGVVVWLIREKLAQGSTGGFAPSPWRATTDQDGRWEQSISMWPGVFRVHALVTTEQNGNFYEWYGRAREAALKIVQEQNPRSNNVPGWPNFDSLFEPHKAKSVRIEV